MIWFISITLYIYIIVMHIVTHTYTRLYFSSALAESNQPLRTICDSKTKLTVDYLTTNTHPSYYYIMDYGYTVYMSWQPRFIYFFIDYYLGYSLRKILPSVACTDIENNNLSATVKLYGENRNLQLRGTFVLLLHLAVIPSTCGINIIQTFCSSTSAEPHYYYYYTVINTHIVVPGGRGPSFCLIRSAYRMFNSKTIMSYKYHTYCIVTGSDEK